MYVLEQSGRKAYDGGDSLLSLALAVSHVTFAPVVRGCVVVFVLRDASGEVILETINNCVLFQIYLKKYKISQNIAVHNIAKYSRPTSKAVCLFDLWNWSII